jgi:hypothetical protein
MKQTVRFPIYKKIATGPRPFGPELSDEDFARIAKLSTDLGLVPRRFHEHSIHFMIICEPENGHLSTLLGELESTGWKATKEYVPIGSTSLFNLSMTRHYSEDDLDGAELLSFSSFGNNCYGERLDHGWMGFAEQIDWARPVYSFGLFSYFVSDSMKKAIMSANLKGAEFSKVHWNDPSISQGDLWEIQSSITMPDCKVQVIDEGGLRRYFEPGYTEPELSFDRTEVKKKGSFDIAYCREVIGNPTKPEHGEHMIVVSQEFHEMCKRLLINNYISFTPVRLV